MYSGHYIQHGRCECGFDMDAPKRKLAACPLDAGPKAMKRARSAEAANAALAARVEELEGLLDWVRRHTMRLDAGGSIRVCLLCQARHGVRDIFTHKHRCPGQNIKDALTPRDGDGQEKGADHDE